MLLTTKKKQGNKFYQLQKSYKINPPFPLIMIIYDKMKFIIILINNIFSHFVYFNQKIASAIYRKVVCRF